jgi:hypothetical protein
VQLDDIAVVQGERRNRGSDGVVAFPSLKGQHCDVVPGLWLSPLVGALMRLAPFAGAQEVDRPVMYLAVVQPPGIPGLKVWVETSPGFLARILGVMMVPQDTVSNPAAARTWEIVRVGV